LFSLPPLPHPTYVDPPEKIKVSRRVINVVENEFPNEVTCSATALPQAGYVWKYGKETVSNEGILFLNYTLKRDKGGDYECVAYNQHGSVSTVTTINVQCKVSSALADNLIRFIL
jgi:hypothetical protein